MTERKRQQKILTQRYWDCLFGDIGSIALLILQAPLIGWLCTLVWGSVGTNTPMLYFVLCLSSVWFGCVNGCREIVKERSILKRERLFGLSIAAYVQSKFIVLATLGFLQVLLLLMAVEWQLELRGPFLIQLLALWLAALAGVSLGLTISSFSRNQERAVLAVPLLIIPQLLFSEMAIPEHLFGQAMRYIEKVMPVRWSFEMMTELAANTTSWLTVLLDCIVLLLFSALLSSTAILGCLSHSDD